MPQTHIDRDRVVAILRGPKMAAYLDAKAETALAAAKAEFEIRRKHLDRHVPDYEHSFFIKKRDRINGDGDVVPSRKIGNSSRRWYWVEFGAHAGGKTPVLHYRILGLTLNVLESGAGG